MSEKTSKSKPPIDPLPKRVGQKMHLLSSHALRVVVGLVVNRDRDTDRWEGNYGLMASAAFLSDPKFARQGAEELVRHGILIVEKPIGMGRGVRGIWRVNYDPSYDPESPTNGQTLAPIDPNIGTPKRGLKSDKKSDKKSDPESYINTKSPTESLTESLTESPTSGQTLAPHSNSELELELDKEDSARAPSGFAQDVDELAAAFEQQDEPETDPNTGLLIGGGPRPHVRRPNPDPTGRRAKVYADMIAAMNPWSQADAPVGVERPIDPHWHKNRTKIDEMIGELQAGVPIRRGEELVPRVLLVPQAVEILMGQGKSFQDVPFACGCIKAQIRKWSAVGTAAQPNTPPVNGGPKSFAQQDQQSVDETLAAARELRRRRMEAKQ